MISIYKDRELKAEEPGELTVNGLSAPADHEICLRKNIVNILRINELHFSRHIEHIQLT